MRPGTSSPPTTRSTPGSTGLKLIADEIGRGVKITDQPLHADIAEAAFKMWGWKPNGDKKNHGHKK